MNCVVRLKTSYWDDNRGVHLKKSITFLKRQSDGFNIIKEDVVNIGATEVVQRIVNLDSCVDGVYKVMIVNEHRDYESGMVDDYDYQLVAI